MTTAEDVLNMARSQLGEKERPPGSNNIKYNTWYYGHPVYGPNYPWCAVFVSWVFNQLNAKDLIHVYSAYSGDILNAMRDAGEEVPMFQAKAGDIVTYDYGDGGITDHIGIVEKPLSLTIFQTIEGNTGDAVARKRRSASDITMWFTRPKYTQPQPPEEEEVGMMFVPPQKMPRQGGLNVWDFVEGFNQLAIYDEVHCWLNLYNESMEDIEVLWYTSPPTGEHKETLAGWSRKSIDIGAITRSDGIADGFTTVVKSRSENLVCGISVFAK